MRIITRFSAGLLALLLLMPALCSCQSRSAGVIPQDPFATAPSSPSTEAVVTQPVTSETNHRVPPPAPAVPFNGVTGNAERPLEEMQPFYAPEPNLPRIVQHPVTSNHYSNEILQVAFLEETEKTEPAADPRDVSLHALTIDPALTERGVTIMAQHRNGQESFQGAWRPSAGLGFWPQIEYLADGGDDGKPVYIEEDWTVQNLEAEDTVAHFDTLDGRTLVEASNRVHIYAPRFGAVRKIEGLVHRGQITALSTANNQTSLNVDRANEQLGFTAQETQSGYARSRDQLGGVGGRRASLGTGAAQGLGAYSNFESAMLNSNLLRQRAIGSAELVYLAEGSAGARAWQGTEGLKVRINALAPMAATSEEGAESFFQIEEDESKTSKLRLIKVASKKDAQPGDIVEFTLRFDNIGNRVIGNVTILDNLTTRLEFLPGSAKSSLPSGFVVEPNENGSFTLRFEITDPLEPGQFGVVQFQCRVL